MNPRPLLLLAALAASPPAAATITWSHALRSRIEWVDASSFPQEALAPTLRLRSGASFTDADSRFGVLLEVEAIAGLGHAYNSGANGETAYPAVTDPSGVELNQANVFWRDPAATLTLGRQRLLFDNHRFIGNSGWRQNEQTFDALDAHGERGAWTWRVGLLDRVHRIAGDDARDPRARQHDLRGQLANLRHAAPWGTAVGYAYLIENETLPLASSRSVGLRWTTPADARVGLALEAAQQTDYRNPGADFSHGYRLAEASATLRGVTWRGGWEQLRGDGQHAFQTPLATLHAFNGWADVFTTTPAAGLDDRYVGAGGAWAAAKSNWNVVFHDFRSTDSPTLRYGREWNASLTRSFGGGWSGLVKLAIYEARGFGADTTKLWLQLEWVR